MILPILTPVSVTWNSIPLPVTTVREPVICVLPFNLVVPLTSKENPASDVCKIPTLPFENTFIASDALEDLSLNIDPSRKNLALFVPEKVLRFIVPDESAGLIFVVYTVLDPVTNKSPDLISKAYNGVEVPIPTLLPLTYNVLLTFNEPVVLTLPVNT